MKNLLAIEKLVEAFESKALSRRELVTSIAALMAATAGAEHAGAQISQAAQARTLNHVSLAVDSR